MDNLERQVKYVGGTTADVLNLIKAGQENDRLTAAQRKRKKHKRGRTRRLGRVGGLHPTAVIRDEVFPPPRVVEVYGQRWELP